MGKVHGKDTAISIDGDDLSVYANSIEWSRTADVHDVTTFQSGGAHVYQSGLTDGTATISGIYDDTQSTGPAAVLEPLLGAGEVELVYEPEGTGSGKPIKTVNVVVTSYSESAPVADMISWTCEVQLSGAVAITTGA